MKKQSGIFIGVAAAFLGVVFGMRCQIEPQPVSMDPLPVVEPDAKPEPAPQPKPVPPVLPQPAPRDLSKVSNDQLLKEFKAWQKNSAPRTPEIQAVYMELLTRPGIRWESGKAIKQRGDYGRAGRRGRR